MPTGYFAISSGLLQLSDRALASYYCLPASARAPELLCSRGDVPTADALTLVRERCCDRVLIPEKEFPGLSERLMGRSGAVLTDARLSQAERLSMLLAARSAEVDAVLRLLRPERLVGVAKQVAEDVLELLQVGRVESDGLLAAPRFGSQWLTHGAAVACYSVLLAIAVGVRDQDDLRRLAIAAMLHDLGQRRDGDKAFAKLSREEREEAYLSHPQRGFEDLLGDSDLDRRQLMVVYQHHESPDGRGFPVAVTDNEIHPWAKLVTVVDAFDEFMADGLTAEQAFRKLRGQAGSAYDTEMVRCWTQVMSKA